MVTGCIDANTALGYFGNANGIMMMAMFVVAAGFSKTQFVKNVSSSITHIAKGSLTKIMAVHPVLMRCMKAIMQPWIFCNQSGRICFRTCLDKTKEEKPSSRILLFYFLEPVFNEQIKIGRNDENSTLQQYKNFKPKEQPFFNVVVVQSVA